VLSVLKRKPRFRGRWIGRIQACRVIFWCGWLVVASLQVASPPASTLACQKTWLTTRCILSQWHPSFISAHFFSSYHRNICCIPSLLRASSLGSLLPIEYCCRETAAAAIHNERGLRISRFKWTPSTSRPFSKHRERRTSGCGKGQSLHPRPALPIPERARS
jgi:hypothetical protein